MTNPSYFDRYENLAFSRDDNGVLTMRFHTNGGPIIFTGQTHEDLPFAPAGVSAADEDNRAMILTGTWTTCSWVQIDRTGSLGDMTKPDFNSERTRSQGIKILERFPSLPFPVVGVANGPATCRAFRIPPTDIHISAGASYVQRRSSAPDISGSRPATLQVVWEEVAGMARTKWLLGERREHRRCYRHGVVCCRGGPTS